MRGCLSVLLIAALFLGAVAWLGGPPIAGALVTAGLTASGLDARRMDVDVESDPPIKVGIGQADRVTIEADDIDWNGLKARALDLALDDVDIIGRRAATAEGRLTGAELPNVDPPGSLATVEIDGPADDATVTVTIDGETVEAMAIEAFEARLGVRPDSATLEAPNRIRIRSGGLELAGGIEVSPAGDVHVVVPLGTLTVVDGDPSVPFQLTDATVESGTLVLTGSIDLNDLMGG
ncbi:MAG TPA: hypothetical protein VFV72_14920 [Candidatus Limnocylindrales bacterium]|nr:hypothetical protein [Candidatus Limnocylindrales bacterium]